MSLAVVILAAGKGTRMRSDKPKVLHELAGKPLVQHVIDTAYQLSADEIIVVAGHKAEQLKENIKDSNIRLVIQQEQHGTGHALQVAEPEITAEQVLVLYGDVPLTSVDTLKSVLGQTGDNKINLLTVKLENPTGYGRIIRNESGSVEKIVEEKDADEYIRKVQEGNTGILSAKRADLKGWLSQLNNNNAQGEYYLTDCIELCIQGGGSVEGICVNDELEVFGVNNKLQLNKLERYFQKKKAAQLMTDGVTLADRNRIDIRGNLKTGKDVFIDINCVFIGDVVLGDGVTIGPNTIIIDSTLGDDCEVLANSIIEKSIIENVCHIGPFARLRPNTHLHSKAKIGNFVETKNSIISERSKVNHLSYVGDSDIGEDVNIGAGTITCNYDGANKHRTTIGNEAFIGSNTAIVAPVTIGSGATIGAGSTVTSDAEKGKLTLTRAKQRTIDNWERPKKEKK